MKMNTANLHLEDCPFGSDTSRHSADLLYDALKQIAYLSKLILWIRCIYHNDFRDENNRSIRKISLQELTGNIQTYQEYKDYLSNNCIESDPLDLSSYVARLIKIYEMVELANGATLNE